MTESLSSVFSRLLDRSAKPRTEAMVQADVRQLLIQGGLNLDEDQLEDVTLEAQVGQGRRIDVEVGATVIEIKRDLRVGRVLEDGVAQLRGYVESREHQHGTRYVGVLTDGAEWRAYQLHLGKLSQVAAFDLVSVKDGGALIEWLEGVLATTRGVLPSSDVIRARMGSGSSAHAIALAELEALYAAHGDHPEVKTKRHLWARLLTAALGTQFEDDARLFVEHTLLVNSAEIIAHALLGLSLTDLRPAQLLGGGLFEQSQVHGVVEADFFDWVLVVPGGEAFVKTLARRLGRFDWSHVEHDILKVLYESIIKAETRKKLGEYYTPDWLAQRLVDEVVTAPLAQRVLDPACGSGTFLFHAVRRYLSAADDAGLTNRAAIDGVTSHVLGIDLHPVAVTLARVTYLLALGRARLNQDRGPIHIPVYLGDSLQWRQTDESLWSRKELIVDAADEKPFVPGPTQGRLALDDSDQFHFPRSLIDDFSRFERLIKDLSRKAQTRTRKGKPLPSLAQTFTAHAVPEDARKAVTESFQTLCRLHDEGRNHIWGYYIRNLARPQWMAEPDHRVDVLVGNPPWLAYRHMPSGMQAHFKALSQSRHLWHGAKLATQHDLSGLFAVRAVQLFLKRGGAFAFVMPSAVLQGGQFKGFRTGRYDQASTDQLRIAFTGAWDLRKVRPHFFPITCSVILGQRSDAPRPLAGASSTWSGRLPEGHVHAGWDVVAPHLKVVAPAPRAPTRTASAYAKRFRQGATIVPRVLFFVEVMPAGPLGLGSGRTRVRSARSASEKKPWKDLARPQRVVESEFVRLVHLGETILPYRALAPRMAVIPRDRGGMLDGQNEKLDRYPGLAEWWRHAEALWDKNRSSERLDLVGRLDFHKGLSNQFPLPDQRVVYTKSGMHLAAARVTDRRVVVDHTLYCATVASEDEGRYLCAILNASVTTTRTRPLMSYGKDERHIDKYVWQLAIPEYDASVAEHRKLAKLAHEAEELVAALKLDLATHFATNRRAVRSALEASAVGREIESRVAGLLDRD